MKAIQLELDNGQKESVLFNNYFLRLLSRLITKEKAKTVEETIVTVFDVVKKWQGMQGEATSHEVYSDFDTICVDLIPVVCAGSNAYKEANNLPEDTDLDAARKVLNHIDIGSLMLVLGGVIECIVPQGLPEDKKKESEAESEKTEPLGTN